MVPFADFINHHNVDSSYELISKDMKPTATGNEASGFPQAYFTVSKKEIDYSEFYIKTAEEIENELEEV